MEDNQPNQDGAEHAAVTDSGGGHDQPAGKLGRRALMFGAATGAGAAVAM